MYQYEYEIVNTGGGMFQDNGKRAHREMIDRRAKAGWRYVGFMPNGFTSHGGIGQVDLIFEKEADAAFLNDL